MNIPTDRPIRPDEFAELQKGDFPEAVWQAFNEMIFREWNGSFSIVRLEAVVDRIVFLHGCPADDVYKYGWLNIEEAFRSEGWDVKYEKPAYNEPGHAYFKFSRKGEKK